MSRIQIYACMAAVIAATSGAASAQSLGGGLRIGAPAQALEVDSLITDRFGLRAFLNGVSLSTDSEPGLRYDGKSQLGSGFLLADWHPYASGFRLSGGLTYSNQYFSRGSLRSAGTIDEAVYATGKVGSLDGRAALSKASPYLGVGWGLTPRAGSRLYFSADLGVMYQRPSASLIGNCSSAFPASVCHHLQHDIRGEDAEFRDTADDFRFYPVISVGFGLRF